MCGIFLYLYKEETKNEGFMENINESFMSMKSRGPDFHYLEHFPEAKMVIGFHRLAIMDTSSNGNQPFIHETDTNKIYVICNGEIYNYTQLCEKYNITLHSHSDCEVLLHMYSRFGIDMIVNEIDAEFAFCIVDFNKITNQTTVYAARDLFGIRPLFMAGDKQSFVLSSLAKGTDFMIDITKLDDKGLKQFPPRQYMKFDNTCEHFYNDVVFTKYFDLKSIKTSIYDLEEAKMKIKESFIKSVEDRLSSDREIGCLLSGGLDSSLVASIASRFCQKHGKKLHTFSIGMNGSTDKYYAEKVAEHINSIHKCVEFTEQQFLNAVPEVIDAIETHDITTVRASVGQYLISKWISEHTNIKVLLIGDGSDELTAGYMYFHMAPNAEELHTENIRLLEDIHYYDVLRADRGVAVNGLEARVPFLSKDFVSLYLSIDPKLRKPLYKLEKWLLRTSFEGDFLPEEVRMRKKEAFSDGISSKERSWFQILQDNVKDWNCTMKIESNSINKNYIFCFFTSGINNEIFNIIKKKHIVNKEIWKSKHCFNINWYELNTNNKEHNISYWNLKVMPPTKEAMLYILLDRYNLTEYYWMPKWIESIDPSARTLSIYNE